MARRVNKRTVGAPVDMVKGTGDGAVEGKASMTDSKLVAISDMPRSLGWRPLAMSPVRAGTLAQFEHQKRCNIHEVDFAAGQGLAGQAQPHWTSPFRYAAL